MELAPMHSEGTDIIPLEQKIGRPSVKPVFRNVQSMAPAERRLFYTSLHNQTDDVEEQVVENVEPPTLEIPRQPRSQPKVLQQILQKRAQAVAASSTSVVSTEEQEVDGKVKLMGIGRGHKTGNGVLVGNTQEKEVDGKVKLMGMGRGRKIENDSS